MWKPLWVLAVLASTFFVKILAVSSHSSRSSHSSSVSSSSSSSSSYTHSHGGCGPAPSSKKCPKPNEILDSCLNPCPPRFCGVNIAAISCAVPETCKPGCRCADGYLRNDKGICISEDKCPTCTKPNEEYDVCPALCPPRECGVNKALILCQVPPQPGDPECEPGCRCFDGYLRNSTGICIPEDDCPKCTQPNEVYDECPAPCPPRRCDVDDRLIRCAAPPKPGDPECEPGCRCADGYVRNNDGICVTRDQCPPKCGDHEVYAQCPPAVCRPKECTDVGFPIACPALSSDGCPEDPACICEEGYVKNKHDQCVPLNQCPSCGGDPNAVSGCGINCNRHCSDRNKRPGACVALCLYNACDCKEGFYFDDNIGKCVRPEKCTPTCKQNEEYSDCINICQPQNCSQLGFPIDCPASGDHCMAGCKCKDGYIRADNGTCIPTAECPSCGGDPHAEAGCGVNCNKLCSDLHGSPKACLKICKVNACDCKKGYYYDDHTKKCVLPKQCTPECKKKHEVSSNCVNEGCEPRKCTDLGFPKPCEDIEESQCVGGCVCDAGYVYDDRGHCIPKDQCPSCGGDPNAVSGCGLNCGRHCSNYNKGPVPCPRICFPNACDCKKEFVFDDNIKKCVLPKQCTPVCKENEVYSDCINGGCQAKNCSQLGKPIPCIKIDPAHCIKGCLCKEGYLRAGNGTCVPEDQCDQICHGANEYYDSCPPNCPPQTCESIGKIYHCPLIKTDVKDCKGACRCKEGFYRNKIGECISEKDCLKCQGPHEYFSCGGACDNVCATLHEQNQTNCPIVNIVCNPMCYCEKDYARDNNNTCVPIDKCPTPICKQNEVYDTCANGGCSKRNCSQIDEPEKCVHPKICYGGCVCQKGYLRNDEGVCVPENECPRKCNGVNEYYDPCPPICPPQTCESIGKAYSCPAMIEGQNCNGTCRCNKGFYRNKIGDCISEKDCLKCQGPNEFFSCGGACDNVCATLDKQNQTNCPIVNIKCNEMCYCETDFARDDNGICIPINQCGAPVCKPNEVYDLCANGGCRHRNCSDLGGPILCIDPIRCEGGCICKKGYLLAENGTCVPEEQCPNQCKRPHEVYNPCPSDCPPQTCESLDRAYACPIKACDCNCPAHLNCDCNCCKGDCVCEDGYYRNVIGECILEEDCRKCKIEFEYYSCRAPCDNVCATLDIQNQTSCPLDSIECKCFCEEGYARDKDGNCIIIDDCPEPRCGPNEKYEEDLGSLCEPFYCTELGFPIDCPRHDTTYSGKKSHCICREEYVRDSVGICIPKTKCDSCGGDPNAVSGCGNKCGKSCSDYQDDSVVCTAMCYPNGCDCRHGYVFDEKSNKCVHPEDCQILPSGG